ncbi:MAG: tRNA (cytosine(32)/uridine(32)-2'-O)-methyltransferase TrmJ [Gammaproteobacteria bacterium]
MLQNIHFILTEPSHPGNIGACARALKTMGLDQLVLINPKKFPDPIAVERAAGADDILSKTTVVESFSEAVASFELVIGTSARDRSIAWPMLEPREAAALVLKRARTEKIALVFGRERTGLFNEELQQCHYHLQIPANEQYSSLNLAAAVQVIAYEIRMAYLSNSLVHQEKETSLATKDKVELFYEHLEKVLYEIEFIKPNQPNRIMPRLRRLFQRAQLETMEIDILRGILKQIER